MKKFNNMRKRLKDHKQYLYFLLSYVENVHKSMLLTRKKMNLNAKIFEIFIIEKFSCAEIAIGKHKNIFWRRTNNYK